MSAVGIDGSRTEWTLEKRRALEGAVQNGRVGSVLVSETDRVRVWHLSLSPGEAIGFHCHVLDYFWTALSAGSARSFYEDGRVAEVSYSAGDTKHFTFGPGERMVHNLENIGDSTLAFVTVEFKDGANTPLEIV